MSRDTDMCAGVSKEKSAPCPKRMRCLRFVKGLSLNSYDYPIWWVAPPKDYDKCLFFIPLNEAIDPWKSTESK